MRKPSPAMIVALAALFVALGGVGVAATGGNFILGQSNTAGAKTSLSAQINGKALDITNNNTGSSATALGLNVASGRPPFAVNSQSKVANLNADKLDGLDSTSFLPKTGKAADSNKLDGQDSTAFLPSSGDITLWYSPYDYAGEYLPISVTLARTDGPSVVATSSSTSNQPVVLPLDQPQSIFGRALKLKSVTVCFASAGAPITSTQIVYGVISEANIAYADTYTHSSTEKTCYDVSPTTPAALPGSAYLRLTVYFSSNAIYLYSVKEVLGT
jgi:hypothetical protein